MIKFPVTSVILGTAISKSVRNHNRTVMMILCNRSFKKSLLTINGMLDWIEPNTQIRSIKISLIAFLRADIAVEMFASRLTNRHSLTDFTIYR